MTKSKKYLLLSLTLLFSISIMLICNSCQQTKDLKSQQKFKNSENINMQYDGFYKNLIDFTKNNQLLDKDMWKQFVDVYRTKEDSEKSWWRCEYWGKAMRGAVLCYKYDKSDELYNVLEETVRDLLTVQDSDGAFTTYDKEKEFNGWDIWGRKYIMTSLLGFMDICKDNSLKDNIKNALCKHANCIVDHIGSEANKIEITNASNNWLGVNSASILEPFVNLYEVTHDQKYLDFAKYIVDTGGIRSECGNLIDICKNTDRMPYQYPEVKAYETMSFFEGVYRYALITNNEDLKNVALKFFDDVDISEISVTGNAGNEEEIFNNGAKTQTINPNKIGQETCVTVTWMRIQDLLFRTTGDVKYYENLKKSGLNAFLGCVNYYSQGSHDTEKHGPDPSPLLPFDSYSPLNGGQRGQACGGFLYFKNPLKENHKYYGCCACISSAAVGLISQDTILEDDNFIKLNDFYNGKIESPDYNIEINSDIFAKCEAKIKIDSNSNKKLKLLIPNWASYGAAISIDGGKKTMPISGAYFDCEKPLKDIKEIVLKLDPTIKKTIINDKVSLSFGSLTLAIDTEANPNILDVSNINISDINIKNYIILPNQEDDLVRISVPYKGGNLILKSYASSGKHWQSANSHVSVFLNNK